jgi:hypothetical protein
MLVRIFKSGTRESIFEFWNDQFCSAVGTELEVVVKEVVTAAYWAIFRADIVSCCFLDASAAVNAAAHDASAPHG